MEQGTTAVVVGLLGLIVAFLSYRVNKLNRLGSLPLIVVEWKTSVVVRVHHTDKAILDRYVFFEGIFTNNGGKTVSLIELVGEEGFFVRSWRLFKYEKIKSTLYDREHHCFLLSQPASHYLTKKTIFEVIDESEVGLDKEIPLNISIDPGKTHRFTLCIFFPNYERQQQKGFNTIIGFMVRFNNGQTAATNLIDDDEGEITIGESRA